MRISHLPALLIVASALGACSAGSGESSSQAPKLNTGVDATSSQIAPLKSEGIASYLLREQFNPNSNRSELIHSIEVQGLLADQYFVRFCYQGNCWGNADFRIYCSHSSTCALQVADRANPGQFLEADRSEVQILKAGDSKKRIIEFVDPFFDRLDPNFVYQVWSVDSNGQKSLETITKLSAE